MKSLHRKGTGLPGNINLRGKKSKDLSCQCCFVQNFKEKERIKEAIKEMRQFWYKENS